jgi:outer membrane protein assembly factor BamE (lipoprotein component of BamABCDE complex)
MMEGKRLWLVLLGVVLLVLPTCAHRNSAGPDGNATNLTVGKVQGEIKVGLSGSEVATILGSPNIVSTDEKRREVWIYDKVSSNRVDTANTVGGGLIIVGAVGKQRKSTTTQKTLTIIIKFDEEKKVRDFAYNYTQF